MTRSPCIISGYVDSIKQSAFHAADAALRGESGVAGLDEDNGDVMSTIPFPRIKGGKPFDIEDLLAKIQSLLEQSS